MSRHVLPCHLLTSDVDGYVRLTLALHVVQFVMSRHALSCHVMSRHLPTLDGNDDVHLVLALRVVHFVMS
jgi:hypothetical protein